MTTPVPCPACALPLDPPGPTCPHCGLPLTGPAAGRLWQVDQQILALRQERDGLLASLRAGASTAGAWAPGAPSPASATPTRRRRLSPNAVLMLTGVALVLVAAGVFLAVSWDRLGVAAQVGILGALTAGATAGAFVLHRRGLTSSANAVAALAVGLAAVDAAGAHRLNLAGLAEGDAHTYLAWSAAGIATLSALAAWTSRTITTFAVASVWSAAVVPVAAIAALDPSSPGPVALIAGAAAASFAGAWAVLPAAGPARPSGVAARWAAAGYLLFAMFAALTGAFGGDWGLDPATCAGTAAAIALVCALATGSRPEAATASFPATVRAATARIQASRGRTTLRLLSLLAAVTAFTGPAWHGHLAGLLILAAAASGAAALVALRGRHIPAEVLASVTAASAAALGLASAAPGEIVAAVGPASVAAAAAVSAVAHPRRRALAAGYATILSAIAVRVALRPDGPGINAAALLAVAVVAAGIGAWRRGHPEEKSLGGTATLVAAVAVAYAAVASSTTLAVVLAVVALVAFGYAQLPGRGPLRYGAVASCSAAVWVLEHAADVTVLEAYTLPLAALLALVALGELRRSPDARSWVTVGPALTTALLPSAWASVHDEGLTRPLLVLAVGALVLLTGVAIRWQAPVLVGSVACLIVAASQLAPYAVGAPRWLSLAAAGAVLLAVGVRYEARQANARATVAWVTSLH